MWKKPAPIHPQSKYPLHRGGSGNLPTGFPGHSGTLWDICIVRLQLDFPTNGGRPATIQFPKIFDHLYSTGARCMHRLCPNRRLVNEFSPFHRYSSNTRRYIGSTAAQS